MLQMTSSMKQNQNWKSYICLKFDTKKRLPAQSITNHLFAYFILYSLSDKCKIWLIYLHINHQQNLQLYYQRFSWPKTQFRSSVDVHNWQGRKYFMFYKIEKHREYCTMFFIRHITKFGQKCSLTAYSDGETFWQSKKQPIFDNILQRGPHNWWFINLSCWETMRKSETGKTGYCLNLQQPLQ